MLRLLLSRLRPEHECLVVVVGDFDKAVAEEGRLRPRAVRRGLLVRGPTVSARSWRLSWLRAGPAEARDARRTL